MKKARFVLLALLFILALPCGCGKEAAFHPREGQGWLEAWLKEEEALAESITFRELAETFDWIAQTEIIEISPLMERKVRLPNGETWTEAYRDYTLEVRASFPKAETGRLCLHAVSAYTDPEGVRLTTPWRQTEWDGLTLKTGQTMWLYGGERVLTSLPFSGLPKDGLILVVDQRDRLLPCREVSRWLQ